MKVCLLSFVLAAAGAAGNIPAPLPTGPPVAAGANALQGTWRVAFSSFPGISARTSWAFAADTLTIRDGSRGLKASYRLRSQGGRQLLAFAVLGQEWTGSYALLDGDTLALRLTGPGKGGPPGVLLLTREGATAAAAGGLR
jgi:hypothetical protein